jgi:hypothetical protein
MARSPQTPAASCPSGGGATPAARQRRSVERSDVLVSAVISTYLLTHLNHVLQRAEYGALQEGHPALAANYAELRQRLCLEARSLEDGAANGCSASDQASAA